MSKLLLIHGHPCTGKTTLASIISERLGIPSLGRDELKERMMDEFADLDRDGSTRIGRASYELLYLVAEKFLRAGSSLILESNFEPARARERLAPIVESHEVLEILLEAEPRVLLERFKQRWESGARHRGHVDHLRYADLEARLGEVVPGPLGLGEYLRVDSSRGVDVKCILAWVQARR